MIDHEQRTAIDKRVNYDLLNPPEPTPPPPKPIKLREKLRRTKADHKALAKELSSVCEQRRIRMESEGLFETVKPVDVIAAVRERIVVLAH